MQQCEDRKGLWNGAKVIFFANNVTTFLLGHFNFHSQY